MDIYVRKRVRGPSATLVMTFILGLAIGLSIGYAVFAGKGKPAESKKAESTPVVVAEKAEVTSKVEGKEALPVPVASEPVSDTTAPTMPLQQQSGAAEPVAVETPASSSEPAKPEVWPGRFLFVALEGKEISDETVAFLKEIRPGGVVLREENIGDEAQAIALVSQVKEAVGGDYMPLVAFSWDGSKHTPLNLADAPVPRELGKQRSEEKAREAGKALGKAAAAHGIQMVLGPMLNIPAGEGEKGTDARFFSSDKKTAATVGLAYAEGITAGGVIPIVKYYPAVALVKEKAGNAKHGKDKLVGVSGEGAPVLDVNFRQLAEMMCPFLEAVTRNVPGILVGSVAVPILDKVDPSRPACLSPVLVRQMLREHQNWRYSGVILADDICGAAVLASRPAEKAVVEALAAGCDAVLVLDPNKEHIKAICQAIDEAMKGQSLTAAVLESSVARLNGLKDRLPRAGASKEVLAEIASEQRAAEAEKKTAEPVSTEKSNLSENPASAPTVASAVTSVPKVATPEVPGNVDSSASSLVPVEAKAAIPEVPGNADSSASVSVPAEAKVATPEVPGNTDSSVSSPAPVPVKVAAPAVTEAQPVTPEPAKAEAKKTDLAGGDKAGKDAGKKVEQPPNTEKILHTVEQGDTLGRIAKQYGVKQSDVQLWNGLANEMVKYGSKLIIYKAKDTKKKAESEIKQDRTATPSESVAAESTVVSEDIPTQTYVVRKGDRLHDIAGEYGIRVKQLVELNHLKDANDIRTGQALRVPKHS